MACHNAVQFVQNDGKYYKDIIGAYPGFFGATAFKAMVKNHVKSAKAKGLDRLRKAEVERIGLDDLRAVSRDILASMCIRWFKCIVHRKLMWLRASVGMHTNIKIATKQDTKLLQL